MSDNDKPWPWPEQLSFRDRAAIEAMKILMKSGGSVKWVAEHALRYANAMDKERNKPVAVEG